MLRNACQYQTLVELLRVRVSEAPSKHAYTYLRDGETDALTWNYGELDRRARAIAAWLQSCGAAGERALLLYPPGLDYLAAFFGCLYAGVVAVPAATRRSGNAAGREFERCLQIRRPPTH
jgi:acyl-CoA synthetase (AMP-forming)/AMP-acid ligase II